MNTPQSPRRPKVRLLRPDEPPDDSKLIIRATPSSIDEAVLDIAESALDSADTYVVDRPDGSRVLLYGVSVLARRPGVAPNELLRRFAMSPRYIEAAAGDVKSAGFEVLATGTNPALRDEAWGSARIGLIP